MIWESKNDIPQRALLGYLLSEKVGLWKETQSDCQRIGICENLVVVAVLFVHMLVNC